MASESLREAPSFPIHQRPSLRERERVCVSFFSFSGNEMGEAVSTTMCACLCVRKGRKRKKSIRSAPVVR